MKTNPIDKAKAVTPWWMMEINRFTTLEIRPVFRQVERTGFYCEECSPMMVKLWLVGGRATNGFESFKAFATKPEAIAFAGRLKSAYPHLVYKFGE